MEIKVEIKQMEEDKTEETFRLIEDLSRIPELFSKSLQELTNEELENRYIIETSARSSVISSFLDHMANEEVPPPVRLRAFEAGMKEVDNIISFTKEVQEEGKTRGIEIASDDAMKPMLDLQQALPLLVDFARAVLGKE